MGIEDGSACISHVLGLVDSELSEDLPDLVSISINLGLIEASLTNKAKQQWPIDYEVNCPQVRTQIVNNPPDFVSSLILALACRQVLHLIWLHLPDLQKA